MINFAAYGKMEAFFGAIVGTIVGVFIIVMTFNKKAQQKLKIPPVFRYVGIATMVISWIQLALVLSFHSFAVYTALT
jgi:divalent metal cation (Fe/Co/Zn/Cd) transporter